MNNERNTLMYVSPSGKLYRPGKEPYNWMALALGQENSWRKQLMAKIINFTEFVTGKFAELSNKFQRKHDQYKGSGGELANFRTGALLKYGKADMESMYETLKDYMRKHVSYMETHGIDGCSLGDSLGDIAVYCVIAMYMRECYMQDQQREA